MIDAGYAVTDIAHVLRAAARRRGCPDARIGVLPGAVLVQASEDAGVRLVEPGGGSLTFDQVGRVGRLVSAAERGRGTWAWVVAEAADVRAEPHLRRPAVVIGGNGLMGAGIAVVFGTPWWAVVADGLLGLVVGAALVALSRPVRAAQLMPFAGALGVTLALWWIAVAFGLGPVPLFAVCAPLVVLIPGATVTNAVIELSAGDVVSGGGRFVSGLVVWALLAAGVVAGVNLVGAQVQGDVLAGTGVSAPTGAWGTTVPDVAAWPATVAVAVGVGLFFSASWRLTGVIVATLLLTYAGFALARPAWGPVVAAGLTSAVVLVATRVLESFAPRYPSVVVFRPAYWLLVPGSFGLVAVTSGTGTGQSLLATTVGTIIALTVGTQVGALVVETGESLVRRRRRTRRDRPESGHRLLRRGA